MPPSLAFLSGLANYGPIGIILLAFLLLFWKAFNQMFDNLLKQQGKFEVFMDRSLAALQEIRVNCVQCSNGMQQTAHETLKKTEEKILQAIDIAADKVIAETRYDNELSRPHSTTPAPVRQPYPPVPGMVRGHAR
jgi:hypothetical protein